MQYRNLGASGLQVSVVGVGCMTFGMSVGEAEATAIVHRAIDLGINFFDTADVYGDRGRSETWLGRALGPRRGQAIIATKFAGPMSAEHRDWQGGSRRYVMAAVEASLRRLATDYIDLYQMHVPDGATPIAETLRALDDLIRQGKVRYIGCSNFAAWQLVEAQWTARDRHLTPFISAQNRYSLLTRAIEQELVPAARTHGVGILPYFPLESGLLSGKYRPGEPMPAGSRLQKWGGWGATAFAGEDKFAVLGKLLALCAQHDASILELALGWLTARPWVASVIAGVTSPAQLEQNAAAGLKELPPALLTAADELTRPPEARAGPQRRPG